MLLPETLERRVRDLRRLVDDFEKDYQKKDRELMGKFLRELSGVVQKVGKEKGFTMIVDARGAGVIYGAPEADLTEEITPGAGNRYYLVVPHNICGEGSYGQKTGGIERPVGAAVCAGRARICNRADGPVDPSGRWDEAPRRRR